VYVISTYIFDMSPVQDTARDVDQKASERMNFRTKPHIKKAIQQAAALSGLDDSVFTMSAAYASALATIAAHERTLLEPVDHAAFFAALDTPQEPTAKLRQAFERHRARRR
jgi:uncharacterized protein (DUF1778 family)